MNKKKLSKTALLYVFVAVFVAVLSFISVTLAWYIKTQTQPIGINFANPVVVQLDYGNTGRDSIIETITGGTADSVKPGSKITLNVGVKLAENSSPAYVRARLVLVCDVDGDGTRETFDNFLEVSGTNVSDNNAEFIPGKLSDGLYEPDISNWHGMYFRTADGGSERWFVWKDSESGAAKEVTGGSVGAQFYYGDIIVSPKMDNRFAGKKIRIEFRVEAIQTEGVVDPIACGEWAKQQ